MSIKRFNEFPDGSGDLTNDDILLFMDSPSGNAITKKISLSNLSDQINSNINLTYNTISPAISGTINDWNPGGATDIIRASGTNNARINGLISSYGADAVLLYNVGTSENIILTHASGTENNQFLIPWLGDYVVNANGGTALIIRDKVDNKWRIT